MFLYVSFLVLNHSLKLLQQYSFQRYMVPTLVLISLLITHSTTTNTTNNENSVPSAAPSATISSNFGVYQQILIGFIEILFLAFVPDSVCAESDRKALITKLLLRQITTISNTPSISFSALMSAVTPFFGLNTESAESDTEASTISIRNSQFHLSNLQGVFFLRFRIFF